MIKLKPPLNRKRPTIRKSRRPMRESKYFRRYLTQRPRSQLTNLISPVILECLPLMLAPKEKIQTRKRRKLLRLPLGPSPQLRKSTTPLKSRKPRSSKARETSMLKVSKTRSFLTLRF